MIPWGGARGSRTDCGPFRIDFAAFEGESRHSTMPYEEHAILAAKAEKLGGLYIYRNGIRVLPYGDTDYDWLDIEFRRTKGMAYYYFSHRKMFGFVEIDAERNRGLREKAGRRGFRRTRHTGSSRPYSRISCFRLLRISSARTASTVTLSVTVRKSC